MSRQDVFDAFDYMAKNPQSPEAENLRLILWHFQFPKAPDNEIVTYADGSTNASSPFLEMKWIAANFKAVLDKIEAAEGGSVVLTPEDRAAIIAAVPSAQANAQAVVAEFKKEGN